MREFYEFRVFKEYVPLIDSEYRQLNREKISCKLALSKSDPRFERIAELHREGIKKTPPAPVFVSWNIRRDYTVKELRLANLFRVNIVTAFEPTGEQCGTLYDEENACPICKSNAKQISELWLDTRSIPKNKDFARTLSGEWVASEHAVDILKKNRVSGVHFQPVRHRGKSNYESKWYQLIVVSPAVTIRHPTEVGNDPFDRDLDGRYSCPTGHLLGLRLLSEVYIKRETWSGSDVACSEQLIGLRMGILRPRPILLISCRLRTIIGEEKLRGIETEIVHLE